MPIPNNMGKQFWGMILLLLLISPSHAKFKKKTVTYCSVDNQKLHATLFLPDNGSRRPCLMLIHEGGFRQFDRHCFNDYGIYFANKGFAVMSIDYRLVQRGGQYPHAVRDCIEALRWLKAHAKELEIRKDQITVIGSSAGAYLATLIGVSGGLPANIRLGHGNFPQEDNTVAGVVSSMGLYDWGASRWKGDGFIHTHLEEEASPIRHCRHLCSPILLLAGQKDPLFPPDRQALPFRECLRLSQKHVSIQIKPGQAHAGIRTITTAYSRWALPHIETFLQSVSGSETTAKTNSLSGDR